MSAIATIVAAVLALTGVIVGVVVGIRRWRTERLDARRAPFHKDRQSAYRDIWDAVEDLHVSMRTDDLTQDDLDAKFQQINARMLKSGIYLDDADREAVRLYIEALLVYQKVLQASGNAETRRAHRITQTNAPVGFNPQALLQAQERTTELRQQLVTRMREVLSGSDEADT